eukprot:TRINITY_DN9727_c0_g1_i1.p2 TRINITY_DN9727_c0_g1~~TRINITY_DN9727_c0_g1_i1.p2  ORF type:complete len:110 (-),score=31.45 TRINITY_DN9727_c0_g1_i1:193-522(-)
MTSHIAKAKEFVKKVTHRSISTSDSEHDSDEEIIDDPTTSDEEFIADDDEVEYEEGTEEESDEEEVPIAQLRTELNVLKEQNTVMFNLLKRWELEKQNKILARNKEATQ